MQGIQAYQKSGIMRHAVSCCLSEVARPADTCATLPILPFALSRAIPSLPFAQPFWRGIEADSQQLWQASIYFPILHHSFLQFFTKLTQPMPHFVDSVKRRVVPEGLPTADGLWQRSLLDLQTAISNQVKSSISCSSFVPALCLSVLYVLHWSQLIPN